MTEDTKTLMEEWATAAAIDAAAARAVDRARDRELMAQGWGLARRSLTNSEEAGDE